MVNNTIKYRNPPLKEALFDIRVELDSSFEISKFSDFYDSVKADFPVKQQQIKWETAFQFNIEKPAQVNSKHVESGLLMKSSDNEKVVQVGVEGFTFNKLQPYNGWEKFTTEALTLWKLYVDITKPVKVKRLALRFVNLLKLPLPFDDIKEYLLTSLDIAPDMPNVMSEYLLRIVIPDQETGNKAILTQTIDMSKLDGKTLPLIFDIDVYKEVNLSTDDPELWNAFLSLREYKNLIFEKTLTDKAKALYK